MRDEATRFRSRGEIRAELQPRNKPTGVSGDDQCCSCDVLRSPRTAVPNE